MMGLGGDPRIRVPPSPLEPAVRGSLKCRAQGGRLQLQLQADPGRKRPKGWRGWLRGGKNSTKDAAPPPHTSLALEF